MSGWAVSDIVTGLALVCNALIVGIVGISFLGRAVRGAFRAAELR